MGAEQREGRGRRPATRAEPVSPAYVRRESRAAGWGSEWGRAEAAPPSGIRAGSLAERRVPAEVCVYLLGVERLRTRAPRGGERNGPLSAEVGAGRSARAAAAAATPGD